MSGHGGRENDHLGAQGRVGIPACEGVAIPGGVGGPDNGAAFSPHDRLDEGAAVGNEAEDQIVAVCRQNGVGSQSQRLMDVAVRGDVHGDEVAALLSGNGRDGLASDCLILHGVAVCQRGRAHGLRQDHGADIDIRRVRLAGGGQGKPILGDFQRGDGEGAAAVQLAVEIIAAGGSALGGRDIVRRLGDAPVHGVGAGHRKGGGGLRVGFAVRAVFHGGAFARGGHGDAVGRAVINGVSAGDGNISLHPVHGGVVQQIVSREIVAVIHSHLFQPLCIGPGRGKRGVDDHFLHSAHGRHEGALLGNQRGGQRDLLQRVLLMKAHICDGGNALRHHIFLIRL